MSWKALEVKINQADVKELVKEQNSGLSASELKELSQIKEKENGK